MTNSTDGSLDALHEQLAERSRYEGWLAQLEARRATTPLHVLERVRADYVARLEQVTSHLRGRAVELEATVTALRSRLTALASEEETRRDERAEMELRGSVGEYAADQAAATIAQCDEAIASLTAQRDALGGELSKLQDVLLRVVGQARAQVQAPAPAAPRVAVPDATAVLEPVAVAPAPAAPRAPEPAVSAAVPPAVPPARPQAPQSPSAVEELEFLRSIVSTPEPAAPTADGQADLLPPPVLAAPRRQATPMGASAVTGIRDPLRSVAGDGSLTPTNMPAFLKDMPTEQVKTLKCQECGTMNFPTEWYCERCGGELAAM
jgi:hypothetical protein